MKTHTHIEPVHFSFVVEPRNPHHGRGRGAGGIGNERLLDAYREGLERLYATLTAPPWSRAPLAHKPSVEILDITKTRLFEEAGLPLGIDVGFTAMNQADEPYIVLPSLTTKPTPNAERQWALATAIHEATHVFNCRERPLYERAWEWFDEALAIFMEMHLIPDYQDHFRYLGDWINKPELSLDNPSANYQAGRFVAYLAEHAHLGIEFVNRVWMQSKPTETPLMALTRLLAPEYVLVSTDPAVRDIFASGYCMDSWFYRYPNNNDPNSQAYAHALYDRYGERALTESFVIRPTQPAVSTSDEPAEQDTLDHLACRYYRFYLEGGIRQLTVELLAPEAQGHSPLKAELAVATKAGRRGRIIPLQPAIENPTDTTRLATSVRPHEHPELDHLILVVTNCGTRNIFSKPNDDGKRYVIRARAE